jgi:hypothetical protein
MRTALGYLDDVDEKNRSHRRRGNDDSGDEKEDKKAKPVAAAPPIKALRKVSRNPEVDPDP